MKRIREKNKRVEVRFSEKELELLREKSIAADSSMSELIRESVLRVRVWDKPSKKLVQQQTAQLAKIGNNLNQIAKYHHVKKGDVDAIQVVSALVQIRSELEKITLFPTAPITEGDSKND